MSHQDYIADCDEEQLLSLIELAQARVKQIKEQGYVELWAVSDSWCNYAWFSLDQHEAALDKMIELAKKRHKPGVECQWEVTKVKMRPDEAEKLVSANSQMGKA